MKTGKILCIFVADVFNSEWLPKGSANASLKGYALYNRFEFTFH